MKPLDQLKPSDVAPLVGVIFDLDDTLLDHGRLTEPAYGALFRLKEAGFRLIGATGRPYGWIELLSRQWPVDAMIAENGSAAVLRNSDGSLSPRLPAAAERRAELLSLAARLVSQFPSAKITSDNGARVVDVTIDVGESCRVPADQIQAMCRIARDEGVATVVSSVHLHLTYDFPDKAAGAVRIISEAFGEDETAARRRYAFIGDSGNDAAAFAAFKMTFGVANVSASADTLTLLPRYVAPFPMGRGFAEIAAALVSQKRAVNV